MAFDNIRSGVKRLVNLPLRTRQHIDADADAELESLIAERVDHLVARGVSPAVAREEALRRLGPSLGETTQLLHHSARTREHRKSVRDTLADVLQDTTFAVRTLRRDVRFAASAVAIIALGIGASVTVFSVANALLMRPLPFQDPGRLVWLANQGGGGFSGSTSQVQRVLDLASMNRSLEGIAGYYAFTSPNDTKLTEHRESIRVSGLPVTGNFFDVLGVRPVLGRLFAADESTGEGPSAVILRHSLWSSRFHSDRSIAGRALILNNVPVTVVGVLPAAFDFGAIFAPGTRIDLFTPFPLNERTNRGGNTLSLVARLRAGESVASARAEVRALAERITAANPKLNVFNPAVITLREHVSGSLTPALIVLALAVAAVMLIVCANLFNLLLARATTRHKEMAVRVALGAGRSRLVRQMLTESVVLSACGAAIGVLLAIVGTRVIAGRNGITWPLLYGVRVDGAALGVAALLAIAVGVAFGLVPALQIPSLGVHGVLKDSSRGSTVGGRRRLLRSALVVSEIAMACMLLVGAGLMSRSFLNVLNVDTGFRAERVASLRVDPEGDDRSTPLRVVSYMDEVLRLAREVPGVEQAGVADGLPLGENRSWGVAAKRSGYPQTQWPEAFVHVVSDGYVGTIQTRLIAGRDFSTHDGEGSEKVIMVNEALARALWPGEDPLGQLMMSDVERKVIGVVADVRLLALESAAGMEIYLPMRQSGDFSAMNLVFRTRGSPSALASAIRVALQPIAPDLPAKQFILLQDVVDTSVSPRRLLTVLLAGFATFALLLALLGIYGVISYTVSQRTQEIGVRMALGATATQLQLRIIRETLALSAVGMLVGSLASWMSARALRGMLFGVAPADLATYAGMLVVLTVAAAISGYVPARRASRIDPVAALRGS